MSADNDEPGPGPAAILTGWRDAFLVVAGEFLRPARRLVSAGTGTASGSGVLALAARGFPLAGAAVGLASALVFIGARVIGLPMFVAGALAVATAVFASGGVFESGLARFAEAVAAGGDKDAVLARMRDRAPGYYGIVMLVIVLAMKLGALAAMSGTWQAAAALVAAGAVSWMVMPALLHLLPAASEHGLAARAGVPAFEQAAIAAGFAAALALLLLGPWTGVVALALAAAGAFKMFWFARRSAGGVTGAALGAAQQAAETGVLVAVAAAG